MGGCHGCHEGRHVGEGGGGQVTRMAAELVFSVDAHISLTHSGGKPYECDQCKYSSKMAQNLKAHKLTHSGEKPCACDRCKYSSKTAQNQIFFQNGSKSQSTQTYTQWRKALCL